MVRAIIMGRLGNQLFQYAHAKNIAKEYNADLHLYFFKEKNLLQNYKTKDFIVDDKLNIPVFQRLSLILFLIIRRITCKNDRAKQQKLERKMNKWLNNRGIIFNTVGYLPHNKIKKKNILIVGYFESEKYFDDVKNEIVHEFEPKKNKDKKLEKLYKEIQKENSVAVSIRRGDFVALNNVVCSKLYYDNAIKYINENVKKPKYYIFSDDIEWVKENMNFPEDSWYEDSSISQEENFRLRTMCKHFILANSTFSWWGGYLSNNENKIVIVPKKWRFTDAQIDIVLDDWIKIQN